MWLRRDRDQRPGDKAPSPRGDPVEAPSAPLTSLRHGLERGGAPAGHCSRRGPTPVRAWVRAAWSLRGSTQNAALLVSLVPAQGSLGANATLCPFPTLAATWAASRLLPTRSSASRVRSAHEWTRPGFSPLGLLVGPCSLSRREKRGRAESEVRDQRGSRGAGFRPAGDTRLRAPGGTHASLFHKGQGHGGLTEGWPARGCTKGERQRWEVATRTRKESGPRGPLLERRRSAREATVPLPESSRGSGAHCFLLGTLLLSPASLSCL